jgi:hypothetical protein
LYEAYSLTGNPFEIAPVKYEMAGRQTEWTSIKSRLGAAFDGTTCKFLVLQGDYGLGKTFTADKLYSDIHANRKELRTIVVRTLAGQPIQAHPAEPSRGKFAVDFIARIFENLGFEQIRELCQKVNLDSKVPDLSLRARLIFNEISKGNRSAFLALIGESVNEEGEKLSIRPVKASEEAKAIFFAFLRVMKMAVYNNLLIILDEFEYVMTLSTSRITVILQTLREIFDEYSRQPQNLAKVVIFFTTSPGGWDKLRQLEVSQVKRTGGAGIVPFRQRIDPRDVISLSPLTLDETEELIRIRLKAYRNDKVKDELQPFTEKAIEVIFRASQGVPRLALVYASIILDYATERHIRSITAKDALDPLVKLNLYSPLAESKT